MRTFGVMRTPNTPALLIVHSILLVETSPKPTLARPNRLTHLFQHLWPALRHAARIPIGERFGWHSFRRAFANALRDVPLRELKDLGGWKNQGTVVAVYLRPDENAQRSALAKLAASTR